MKNVLMIAPYFPPRRRVASLRPFKFAIRLKKFGWNPTVLTIKSNESQLTDKEQELLNGVSIVEITPPFDRTTSAAKEPSAHKKRPNRISGFISDQIDKHIPLDTWVLLFLLRYSSIKKDVAKYNPDLIWSTGDPWSGHWLGHKLSKDLEVPWIADFRDPWTLSGLSLRERSLLSDRADRRLEKKFINAADKLIFTARSTEDRYVNHYSLSPGKTDTIYNSYSDTAANMKSGSDESGWPSDIDRSDLNLIFFGSFRRLSPITPIAEAVALLPDSYQHRIKIHSFGKLQQEDRKTLQNLGISDLFATHEKVVPQQASAVFQQADVLLVSTSKDRESIIPAKLWEYLNSDKPVLSITPNPEIEKILDETGAGVHFHNNQTMEIADTLKRAIENKEKGEAILNVDRKPDVIRSYSAKNNTRKLAQIMDTLIGDER